MIQIGQKVYSALYGGRYGVVYAIHGVQAPRSVHTMHSGVVGFGGRATFDIVFTDGTVSPQLPESILYGVQWKIFDEFASAEEIKRMLDFADSEKARMEAEEKARKEKFDAEVAALRNNPKYAYLQQASKDGPQGSKLVALNIRRELKAAFPGTKFSVVKDGWDSVRVNWTDGPANDEVKAITGKYEGGYFDGMDDSYHHETTPWTTVFGDVRYVFEHRNHSVEAMTEAVAAVCARYQWPLIEVKTSYDGSAYIERRDEFEYRQIYDYLEKRYSFAKQAA